MTSSASAPVLLREDRGAVSLLTLNVARGNAAWETAELAWVPVSQVQGADRICTRCSRMPDRRSMRPYRARGSPSPRRIEPSLGDSMSAADQILTAHLTGTARHHARQRPLTAGEHDAAVAALRELAAGRADLLAQVAGLLEGFAGGQPDEPLRRQAAQLCRDAGADEALIPRWIEEGQRCAANALRPQFGAPRRIRPGQHPPGRGG